MRILCPLLSMFLLLFSAAGAECNERDSSSEECLMELGVLDHGSIYVPCEYILAVDGSIRHSEISFVLERGKRSPDRYSTITIAKESAEHVFDGDYIREEGEICGVMFYAPIERVPKSPVAPALSFIFFEVESVVVSIGSMQRDHALQLMRILLRDSCE